MKRATFDLGLSMDVRRIRTRVACELTSESLHENVLESHCSEQTRTRPLTSANLHESVFES